MSSVHSPSPAPADNTSSADYYHTQYESYESDVEFSLDNGEATESDTESPAVLQNTLETIALKAELHKVEQCVRKQENNILELKKSLSDMTTRNSKLMLEIEYFRYKNREYYCLAKAKCVEAQFMDKYGYSLDKTIYWNE